jgi:hypothetical protein
MKKLFVFVPAILLALFLLESFVIKEKDAAKVTAFSDHQTWEKHGIVPTGLISDFQK